MSIRKTHTTKAVSAIFALSLVLMLAACNTTPETANESTSQVAPQTSEAAPAQESMMTETKTYADGEYTVDGVYQTPAGEEKLGVTLTLASGIVEAVEVEQKAVAPISKKMQADFAENYKTQVIGKNISDLKLSKISGSSLTPDGFNNALEQIKTQAGS